MFNRFRKHGLDAEARAVKNAVDALQNAIKAKTEQKVEVKTEDIKVSDRNGTVRKAEVKTDTKFSLPDTDSKGRKLTEYKADVITNVYEEVDGKKTLVRKTFKGATITEKDGYYHIKTKDGTIKRKIGAKGTFVLNGTMETTKDKVLTSVDKELTMRERLQWNRVKSKDRRVLAKFKNSFC